MMISHQPFAGFEEWIRLPIMAIEDLQHAVLGAQLDVAQLSGDEIGGSLMFSHGVDKTFSTARIDGNVSLLGSLPETRITLGIGLHCPPGTLLWLKEVASGSTSVWLSGETYDAIYRSGSTYLTVSLTEERLEELAADLDLVLDAKQLGETRISSRPLDPAALALLRKLYGRLHSGEWSEALAPSYIGELALDVMIEHYARKPRIMGEKRHDVGFARIVNRARTYIMEHLDAPISIAELARASFTSRRTLYRAFEDLLGETPQTYIRNLRLNRIRHDLTSAHSDGATVTDIASRWGVFELGRLAGDYRKLFGEVPSATFNRYGTLCATLTNMALCA
ncbi:helix-turn-helix domain-containing protein [Altererythrobacter salegens]|uniref:Helix-turn-helix domain-containing protein n=1 Tax=Croceibacterium salegens TaxID=1737568 RepID=A0A6I4SRI0_9SPHN|nr:helix-turn-helix domain-containing protein [Croceibacterium salegens]MXO58581.1 helix-turn-helix domain-containing protein [Croceibacterium salegens]